MTVTIILIDKHGNVKQQNVKDLTSDTIYKKCGLRVADGFQRRHIWYIHEMEVDTVELWACNTVKSGQENKYQLPSPLDNKVYYGTMALISVNNNDKISSLSMNTWTHIYESLLEENLNDEELQENDSVMLPDKNTLFNCDMEYDEDEDDYINNVSSQEDETQNISQDDLMDDECPKFIEALIADGSELQEEEYDEY